MRMILPEAGGELDDFGLAEAYAYPRERWLRANMVMSADGSASVEGKSGGLSSPGDKRVFGILRVLADVVLVGSATVTTEAVQARPAPPRAGRPAQRPSGHRDDRGDHRLPRPGPGRSAVHRRAAGRADHRDHQRDGPGRPARGAAKVADVIVAGEKTRRSGDGAHGAGRPGPRPGHLRGRPAPAGADRRRRPARRALVDHQPHPGRPRTGPDLAGSDFPAAAMTLTQALTEDGSLFCRYLLDDPGSRPSPRPAGAD